MRMSILKHVENALNSQTLRGIKEGNCWNKYGNQFLESLLFIYTSNYLHSLHTFLFGALYTKFMSVVCLIFSLKL